MNFEIAFERLMLHEGGYSNKPADPGGETMYGITKRVALKNGYTGNMQSMPITLAKAIAQKEYWDEAKCSMYPPALSWPMFDAAYNSGADTANKLLQRALRVTDDGVIGAVTMAKLSSMPLAKVIVLFNTTRLEYFSSLKNWDTFGKGWARRIAANQRYMVEDLWGA